MPKLLTEPEVAEILRCSPNTVARLRKAGKLPFVPGRPVLIDETDLLALIGDAPLLTETQAAERLGLKASQLRWWRDTGRIGSCPIHRSMYREEDLRAYFAAQEAKRAREAANLIAIEEWRIEQALQQAQRAELKLAQKARRIAQAKVERAVLRIARKAAREAKALIPVLRQARNGFWYLHWREGRRTKRVSTRTRNKQEAHAVLMRSRRKKSL
jgi:hypothetical protein